MLTIMLQRAEQRRRGRAHERLRQMLMAGVGLQPGRFGSAADYKPGCVAGPDGSGEVDGASAPVLVDVLAYQHCGV